MSGAVFMACLWCVSANGDVSRETSQSHWPAAYVLMTFGIPILAWVYWVDGPVFGAIFTLAGMSILRWPVRYLARWLRRLTVSKAERSGSA